MKRKHCYLKVPNNVKFLENLMYVIQDGIWYTRDTYQKENWVKEKYYKETIKTLVQIENKLLKQLDTRLRRPKD